jgi:hypothetical protein
MYSVQSMSSVYSFIQRVTHLENILEIEVRQLQREKEQFHRRHTLMVAIIS